MRYCQACKVHLPDDAAHCPLCQGPVSPAPQPGAPAHSSAFPAVPMVYKKYNLFYRLLVFCTVAAVVVCFGINYLLPQSGLWSLFVAGGAGCLWISLADAVHRRRNPPRGILNQVILLGLLALVWDLCTGWRGWSITFVIPFICLLAMAAMAVVAKVIRLPISDYLIYLCVCGGFGILPILSLALGWVSVRWPSLLCAGGSVLSLTALAVFEGEKMLSELRRRLHL